MGCDSRVTFTSCKIKINFKFQKVLKKLFREIFLFWNIKSTSASLGKSQLSLTLPAPLPMPLVVEVIDEADGGGVMGGGGGVIEVLAVLLLLQPTPLSSELRSSVTRRTAPTRSLAMRDHDSMRLWASQQAAGPRPLIFSLKLDVILAKSIYIFRCIFILYFCLKL